MSFVARLPKIASRIALAALFVSCSTTALRAIPISSCVSTGSSSFTCNLYETDNGTFSNLVTLPLAILPADVVLTTPGGSLSTPSSWLDAVVFTSTTAQLFNRTAPGFPSAATVQSTFGSASFVESSTNPTTIGLVGGALYNLYTVSPASTTSPVPEPGSLLLAGSGLAAGLMRLRRRSA